MKKTLSQYVKKDDMRLRAGYINHNVTKIDLMARDAHSLAEAAYDMAHEKMSRDRWMEGLTTEQVDSVRLGHKPKPYVIDKGK